MLLKEFVFQTSVETPPSYPSTWGKNMEEEEDQGFWGLS